MVRTMIFAWHGLICPLPQILLGLMVPALMFLVCFIYKMLPRRGTTREVGGMISASSRKNTVRDSRMLIDKLT